MGKPDRHLRTGAVRLSGVRALLVERGIDSISLNPDAVLSTTQFLVLDVEAGGAEQRVPEPAWAARLQGGHREPCRYCLWVAVP